MGAFRNLRYTTGVRGRQTGKKATFSISATVIFILLSVVTFLVFRGLRENNRLTAYNTGERAINDFITALRNMETLEDAEAALEENERIFGIGAYTAGGEEIFALGTAPPRADLELLPPSDSFFREYVLKRERKSIVILQRPPARPGRMSEPDSEQFGKGHVPDPSDRLLGPEKSDAPPGRGEPVPYPETEQPGSGEPPSGAGSGWTGRIPKTENERPQPAPGWSGYGTRSKFLRAFFRTAVFYWEIHVPKYWLKRRFYSVMFPIAEIILAFAVWYIARLVWKNAEYRRRLEEQKNLVLLGTAASTLAHEIKNPLSAIRLQTGILERSVPESSTREIEIINDEVDRLSMLAKHVNDYLRDPAGKPELFDPLPPIRDTGRRILGREVTVQVNGLPADGVLIYFDRERFRSVMENLFINASESGSDPGGIEADISEKDETVRIEVRDRGKGIDPEALPRMFDPFFTTKSRGTGVGLAVIRRFVEAAGGTVFLVNREGGGIAAGFEIPRHIP